MQPQWTRWLTLLAASNPVKIRYKMGGLLPSWKQFHDAVNSIRKPAQMGPEWMHARRISGANIDGRIWIADPPASSFPACIAVKCAELQSAEAGAGYFHLLQEAVMVKNLNIARSSVLLAVASELPALYPVFDRDRFKEDLSGVNGREAFAKDLQDCKFLGITRMPTITLRSPDSRSLMLSGYQTSESLENAWMRLKQD